MAKVKLNEHMFGLRLTFHCLGISCLAAAVFLQVLVFMDIAFQGFFMGVEKNPLILNTEIGLTVFCVVYLLYVSTSRISSFLNSRKN
jgi:aspartate/tyrosine/aromatic aminotransferase